VAAWGDLDIQECGSCAGQSQLLPWALVLLLLVVVVEMVCFEVMLLCTGSLDLTWQYPGSIRTATATAHKTFSCHVRLKLPCPCGHAFSALLNLTGHRRGADEAGCQAPETGRGTKYPSPGAAGQ
jgi:hypothetical protein